MLDDAFCEVLIKKKETGREKGIRILMIVLTAGLVIIGFVINPIMLFVALAAGVADYIIFPRLNVEYEYAYVNGQLDIDKIFSKQSRKRAAEYNLDTIEIVAPEGSSRLDGFRGNPNIRKVDFTSGDEKDKESFFAFVTSRNNVREYVLFQPSEKMIKDMHMRAPGKVFLR